MKDSFYVQWHITNFCPLRCKHCYQDDFSAKDDLDWPGLKKVSDNLLEGIGNWNRTACVHLTGGEPLFKKEIFQLLKELNDSPLVDELGLITNGLLIDPERVKRLSAVPKLRKIKISLDGPDEDINDSIRQKGVFKRVTEILPWVQEGRRFEVLLMLTVMKRNVQSLPSALTLCQDLGIDGLIFERFVPWGRGSMIREDVLSQTEWDGMVKMLLSLFPIEARDDRPWAHQAFQVSFKEGDLELLGAPCIIGTDGLCIMPEGTVYPCRRFPLGIGNLLKDSLTEIWKSSEVLNQLRRKENLKGKCGRCDIEGCRGCRSLAFSLTGDFLEEDPLCSYPRPPPTA